MKFSTYMMSPEAISAVYFINLYYQ
jgi:hypothetical protein